MRNLSPERRAPDAALLPTLRRHHRLVPRAVTRTVRCPMRGLSCRAHRRLTPAGDNRGMTMAFASGAVTTAASPIRLLVVDIDGGFLRVLTKRLERAGWQHRVLTELVPRDAMVAMRLNAVVLDPAVLSGRPWSCLEKLCPSLPQLGVVVCTGRSSVAERVRGLRLGVDDWVTKPCHPEELIARVEAVVRRRKRADPRTEPSAVVVGEVQIRPDQFQAFADGASLDLTRLEFELLQLLAAAEGQVLQREEIYERVWGYAMFRGDRSVDVYVRKLRQKLACSSPGWRYIHTHFGIGYRLKAEPTSPARHEAADEDTLTTASPASHRRPREPVA
jgi:DNA-binding response OmpR family regulator